MVEVAPNTGYAFTFSVKKKRRPNKNYVGLLSTHNFYIHYYYVIPGENIKKAVEESKPVIEFRVRFTELVKEFAKELGGQVIEEKKVPVPRTGSSYVRPIVFLPSEEAFRRHLLYTLVVSTFSNPGEKLNMARSIILGLNPYFVNLLSTIALDRYRELKEARSPVTQWYVLRVGRAINVLYKLD